jgi:hypothetical protein
MLLVTFGSWCNWGNVYSQTSAVSMGLPRNMLNSYATLLPILQIVLQRTSVITPNESLQRVTRINGSTDCRPTDFSILNRTSFMKGGGGGSFVGFNWGQSPLMWSLANGWFISLCYWQVRFLCDHMPLLSHSISFTHRFGKCTGWFVLQTNTVSLYIYPEDMQQTCFVGTELCATLGGADTDLINC